MKELVARGRVWFWQNALEGARKSFGWSEKEIRDALAGLRPAHFYKTERSRIHPVIMLDFYKAWNLNQENVYTHFYIDSDYSGDLLVVNSFKKIEDRS